MISKYKNSFENLLAPLAKSLSFMSPNALTLIGIIPQALFFYLMAHQRFGWAAVALALSCIDMLDGLVARQNHRVTAFGGFLDSTLDRVSDFLIIVGFYQAHLITLNLAAWLLVTTYMISYIRSRAELASNAKITFNQGLIERPERIIFLFLVLLFFRSHAQGLVSILLVLSGLTVFQRVWHAYKKL